MPLPKKPTIAEEGGLQAHLEKEGLDFSLFIKLTKSGLSDNNIGKVFGKDKRTINRWRSILKEERQLAQS